MVARNATGYGGGVGATAIDDSGCVGAWLEGDWLAGAPLDIAGDPIEEDGPTLGEANADGDDWPEQADTRQASATPTSALTSVLPLRLRAEGRPIEGRGASATTDPMAGRRRVASIRCRLGEGTGSLDERGGR